MKRIHWTELLIFVVGTELVGALSALVAGGGFSAYYQSLMKPPLSPPGWLFPVMWGILYAVMGVSAYLVRHSESFAKRGALIVYAVQLFVNFLWSPVFFGLKSLGGAVIVIALLVVSVAAMLWKFYPIRKSAALMNLPYLLWVLYAAYLTVGCWVLNR